VAITADTLRSAAFRARDAAAAAQDDLNAADGKIGDGDTGVMLRRLFEAVATAIPNEETDVGRLFRAETGREPGVEIDSAHWRDQPIRPAMR